MLVRNACMGDMFSSDSKRLGRQLARMQMVWPLSSIVCPILGGWLTTISLRLPMALSAAVVALSLAVVVPRIPVRLYKSIFCRKFTKKKIFPQETLPTSGRKPFTLGMGASPLSAIKLFTSGRRLRAVGLLQLVDSFGNEEVTWHVSEVHRMQVTGWGPTIRARCKRRYSLD